MDKDIPRVPSGEQPAPPLDKPDLARRSLLKAAPLGALAVVAGQGQAAVPAAPPAPVEPDKPTGYHETEHIRKYYRTAAYW
jgi:hypothetical protein